MAAVAAATLVAASVEMALLVKAMKEGRALDLRPPTELIILDPAGEVREHPATTPAVQAFLHLVDLG
jgi:hypothetical protein